MLAAATLPAAIRADDGRRAGYAVAAREYARQIGNHAVRQSREVAALDGHARLLKVSRLDALADSDDHHIRRDAHRLFRRRGDLCASPRVDFADDLRLRP